MSEFAVTKTTEMVLTEQQREVLRQYLMGVLDGVTESDKKAWRRFWNRINKLEPGEIINFEAIFPRNGRFHRKFFAMLNFAFEAWEPNRSRKSYRGMPVAKNFERFRKDVVIQAGFYEQTFDLQGNMQLEAQSISFANMDDNEFEAVYSAVVDVILNKVLTTYKNRAEFDQVMSRIVGFM
jgi:hypothetical protein